MARFDQFPVGSRTAELQAATKRTLIAASAPAQEATVPADIEATIEALVQSTVEAHIGPATTDNHALIVSILTF